MTDLYRLLRFYLAAAVLFFIASTSVLAGGRILFSTAWDEKYLYMGFVVDDQNVVGSNKAPNSKPWEDDDIEVMIDTRRDNVAALGSDNYRMAVSAAGGSAFLSGEDGQWKSRSIFTYKYGATVQGTINNSEDMDRTFSVEIALPWTELGGKPAVGQVMGVNIVRTVRGEADNFVTLSTNVKTPEDLLDPAKWSQLVFAGPGAPSEQITSDKVTCPQVSEPPLIDGLLKAKEWRGAAVAEISQPDLRKPEPVEEQPTSVKAESKDQRYPNESLVLGLYYYWYQGDSRKPAPFDHVRNAEGGSALIHQPINAAGPWMSYDRVEWHKDQLENIRKAGIDTILPVYRGDAVSRKGYADKGLNCLAQALKELKAEGKEYPLVAMFLDTTSLTAAYAGVKPDLRDREVQRTLYGMIKNFFSRVPEEFLLVSQLDDARARRRSCVVVLSSAACFSDFDQTFVQYCDAAFARDFGGARLLWIGESGFKAKAPNLDGYLALEAGLGLKFDDTGWLDVAAVGPGFDESAVKADNPRVRPRLNGKTYQNDWTELISKKPDIIVIDSWNGLHDGSDICPTTQFGYNYQEMTAVESMRFRGMRELDAAYLRHNVPEVIAPQTIVQVEIVARNAGTQAWKVGQGFCLSYRWFKNNKFVDDGIVKIPLMRDVLPGHIATIATGVLAQDKNGTALSPGPYELHFEMVRLPDKWFSDTGDVPLVVPVRIGLPTEARARLIRSTLPTFLKSGATYPFKVTIRNDGGNPWKRGMSVEAICRLYKTQTYTHDSPLEKVEPVELKSIRIAVPVDVEPGRTLDLSGVLSLVDPGGKPIVLPAEGELVSYQVHWALWADKKWLGESDGTLGQTVEIISRDTGAQFLGCVMPREIDADKTTSASVTLKNNGPDAWKNGQYQLGYHWHNLDGSEAAWERPRVSVRAVKPGEIASIQAKVIPPKEDGQYYLVWDLCRGGVWASTVSSTRGGESLAVPVIVKNGKLAHVDLTSALNVPTAAPDIPGEGANFDGWNNGFPSEFYPPCVWPAGFTLVVPSGYLRGSNSGPVTFRYPNKGTGKNGAAACDGQKVAVKEGRYSAAHILGAAVCPNASGELRLAYDNGPAIAALSMTSWESLGDGEKAALSTPFSRGAAGDQPGKRYLKHYTVKLDPTRKLKSITLPKSSDMRIVAITLEE